MPEDRRRTDIGKHSTDILLARDIVDDHFLITAAQTLMPAIIPVKGLLLVAVIVAVVLLMSLLCFLGTPQNIRLINELIKNIMLFNDGGCLIIEACAFRFLVKMMSGLCSVSLPLTLKKKERRGSLVLDY